MDGQPAAVRGLDILVVEDEFLQALVICEHLEHCGCRVTGPASRLESALELACNEPIRGAILDINLSGKMWLPVCAVLEERHVPFVFITGYEDTMIPQRFRCVSRLAKPSRRDDLTSVVHQNFAHLRVLSHLGWRQADFHLARNDNDS